MKILIILILLSTPVYADWDKADTARELLFIGLLFNDLKQTNDIVKSRRVHETNRILGKGPKPSKVNEYFAACAVGHYIVSKLLPNTLREVWQTISVIVQTGTVKSNNAKGFKQDIDLAYNFAYTINF